MMGAPDNPFRQFVIVLAPFFLVAWPYYLNDIYLIALSGTSNLTLLWLLDILFYLLIPSVTLIFLYRRGRLAHVREGFRRPKNIAVTIGLALALAIATHVVFTLHISPWLNWNGCCRTCSPYAFPRGRPWHFLTIVYAAVSAGVMEESVFRAHLLTLLEKFFAPHLHAARQKQIAVFVTGCALFALIHWCEGTGKLASAFLLGMIPAAIYLRTGNLWLPVLWHTMHDALAMHLA